LRNNLKGVKKGKSRAKATRQKKAHGMKNCLKPPSPPFG